MVRVIKKALITFGKDLLRGQNNKDIMANDSWWYWYSLLL